MIMMTMMMIMMMMMIHRTANYRRGRGAANDEVMSFDYNDYEYDDDKKHIEQDFATVKENRTLTIEQLSYIYAVSKRLYVESRVQIACSVYAAPKCFTQR